MLIIGLVATVLTFCLSMNTAVANIITSPPTNAMYQVGDVITLQCTVDSLAGDTLVWSSYYPNRAHALCVISHAKGSHCFLSRYSISTVNNVGGQGHTDYTLVIADARLSDGGSYQCSFVRAASERSVATVVVVDKIQLSQLPVPLAIDQVVPVSCNVTYQSVPYTTLHATMTPVAHLNITSGLIVTATAASLALRQLSKVTLRMSGTAVAPLQNAPTCWIDVTMPQSTSVTGSRVQGDSNDIAMDTNTYIDHVGLTPHPLGGTYRAGQKLTCHADGNPTPTVRWYVQAWNTTKPLPSIQSLAKTGIIVLILDPTWIGVLYTLKCVAYNGLNPDKFVAFTFTVLPAGATSLPVINFSCSCLLGLIVVMATTSLTNLLH